MSDANARGVGEIFGAHERFTAKAGKHQAHQLGASRFDGQTRGEGSGSGEIIYSAGLAIGMKQFLNCVPCRRGHQTNYAPTEREKKRKYGVWCSGGGAHGVTRLITDLHSGRAYSPLRTV